MKKTLKRGFTLIELLAVIIILAIILLIVVPIVLNVVDDARKGAFEASAYGIMRAAVNDCLQEKGFYGGQETTTIIFENGEYHVNSDIELEIRGKKPQNGTIIIDQDCNVEMAIDDGYWCAKKTTNDSLINLIEFTSEDCVIGESEYTYQPGDPYPPILVEGLFPISWDETNQHWILADESNSDSNWYDYDNQKWANVVTL